MRELTPELRALHELARAAAQGRHEVKDLLDGICATVVETFGFQRVSIWRYSAETNAVSLVASRGLTLGDVPSAVPLAGQPLLEQALAAGEAVFVEDARREGAPAPELPEELGVRSAVAVPLISAGECLGFLAADRGGEIFRLDERTLDVLTTIGAVAAAFLAQAIEQSELRRLDELKTNFIALASHELRTPTAVVHGIATTLERRSEEIELEQRRELQRALLAQTDRLRRLVEQLLDLSRLEADAVEISPQRFRVHRRVEELVLMLADERGQDVSIEVPPELETTADPQAFDRIVSNLITNALAYGDPPVLVRARHSDRHFRLVVEDRGRGVAPEFVPLLFERFTREKPSPAGAQGAGLGLSIARSYAEAHGGEIFYEQAEPHGARFELVLPSEREPGLTVDRSRHPERGPAG